ncbi:MAG TPA: DNA-3-methyladenine glycosylase I, partial [Steroidobacteraceae bacterium]|nr:DNA-3-methyladenine glycosylase I [Steroidobacteraceae bacterium]
LWGFVQRRPLVRRPATRRAVPARSVLSDRIARDLQRRGFRFIGTTIVYAFLQAVGVVNDHTRECFRAPRVRGRGSSAGGARVPRGLA